MVSYTALLWQKEACDKSPKSEILMFSDCTVEPRYNEVLGTMKMTLLYQVSHYIRVKNKEI